MRKSGSLKAVIYDALMDGIVRGEYRPGEILTEGRLVEKVGFSRAPVREALACLCGEGILKNLPRCGYEVVRITMDDIRQMQKFRQVLESGLMGDIQHNLTPSRLSALRELAEKCNCPGESMWTHWDYNAKFHIQLVSVSQNEYAVRRLRQTFSLLKCAYGQYYWDKWDYIYPADTTYHVQILDALEKDDLTQAAEYLSMDLQDFAAFA